MLRIRSFWYERELEIEGTGLESSRVRPGESWPGCCASWRPAGGTQRRRGLIAQVVELMNDRMEVSLLFRSDTPKEQILRKAREADASHLLLMTVDRPVTQWVKVELECHDLAHGLLWSLQSKSSSWLKMGMSAVEEATEDLIKDFEKQLSSFPLSTLVKMYPELA